MKSKFAILNRLVVFSISLLQINSVGSAAEVPAALTSQAVRQLVISKSLPESKKPFWKTRDVIVKRMRDDRDIVVSVKRDDLKDDRVRLTMQGAGWVKRPKAFCFDVSQNYARLKEVSDHFRSVQFDPSTNQVYLIMEALGYQERMIMKVYPVSEDWRSELQWEVVWGHFKGMTGYIGFEKISDTQTEMSLHGVYEAKELPLPKILMGFALEVVTQKVGERIRSFIENAPEEAAREKATNDKKLVAPINWVY